MSFSQCSGEARRWLAAQGAAAAAAGGAPRSAAQRRAAQRSAAPLSAARRSAARRRAPVSTTAPDSSAPFRSSLRASPRSAAPFPAPRPAAGAPPGPVLPHNKYLSAVRELHYTLLAIKLHCLLTELAVRRNYPDISPSPPPSPLPPFLLSLLCRNDSLGTWSTQGCKTVLTDASHTKCLCDRLSTFAILAQQPREIVSNKRGGGGEIQF